MHRVFRFLHAMLDRLKTNPGSLRIGNAANVGNSNHVALAKIAKLAVPIRRR